MLNNSTPVVLNHLNVMVDITPEATGLFVRAYAHGDLAKQVDRLHIAGWGVGKNPKLATRLARAVAAGVVLKNASIKHDIHGKRYVSADQTTVMGRRMNADLKRLGF